MNLAFKYPIVFWNCACLIVDSGGNENEQNEDDKENIEFLWDKTSSTSVTSFNDDDDEETDDDDDDDAGSDKKKKSTKKTDYGKIATAIGKMRNGGIIVSPPSINNSTYTFSPDPQNNIIRYGLSGITRVGEDLIKSIIENRPYSNLNDFLNKIKITKPQIVNLIKSGAFDELEDRVNIMNYYINSISDKKQELNLRNMMMLLSYNLIPREKYDLQIRIYNFNRYLKAISKEAGIDDFYLLDNRAFEFYENHFDLDLVVFRNDVKMISQKLWNKIYSNEMDVIRNFIKSNKQELLHDLNQKILEENWNKYADGSLSKWEMDSVSFYSHDHELVGANSKYEFEDFYSLPEEPEVVDILDIKGKEIPIYRLSRIAGTVLDKNKDKGIVTLLTVYGVVTVKIWRNQFVKYNKQISEKLPSGKKKIIEKSWFTRGNKLAIVGIRRGDSFIPKIYARSKYKEPINLIKKIDEFGEIEFQKDRIDEQ